MPNTSTHSSSTSPSTSPTGATATPRSSWTVAPGALSLAIQRGACSAVCTHAGVATSARAATVPIGEGDEP